MKSAVILLLLAVAGSAQTLEQRVKPYLDRALAGGAAFVAVSAASGAPAVAADSLVSLFGPNLASQAMGAVPPYPTTLGGIGVQVVDSTGKSAAAQILYVSAGQVNILMPAGTAAGTATINIINGTGTVPSGTAQVEAAAPALFTANANGQGVVAATAYRTVLPSTLSGPVPVFACGTSAASCVSVPIDPGVDAPVTVTLYATGVRGRSALADVSLSIGGMSVPIQAITSFNDTDPLAGVDEVIFRLPLSLHGAGEVAVVLTVDGTASNAARINVQ